MLKSHKEIIEYNKLKDFVKNNSNNFNEECVKCIETIINKKLYENDSENDEENILNENLSFFDLFQNLNFCFNKDFSIHDNFNEKLR